MSSLFDDLSLGDAPSEKTDPPADTQKQFPNDDTFDTFDTFDSMPKERLPDLDADGPAADESDFSASGLPSPRRSESRDGADEEPGKDLLEELEEDLEDVGQIKRRYMPKILEEDGEFNSSQVPADNITRREVQDLIESIPKPMFQKPFQPGSSPMDDKKRFLCWNNFGIIRAQKEGDRSVDVMFHDTEKHSSVNFKDDINYSYGSLSDDVIVVGSNGKHETGPASLHGVNLLEANRESREWQINLPHVELIEALAAGSGFIAVATDQRNLRFFTNGGMQSFLVSLPSQVVCMAALEQQLLIIRHNGSGQADEQNLVMTVLHVDLLDCKLGQVYESTPVALGRRAMLAWAGFSEEGSPCSYDSSGLLRVYKHKLAKSWVPALDLRELTSSALDHYFVVGVSELGQTCRAVKCKRSRYPDFDTETADIFKFSMPLCELDTDKGALEEEHLRLRMAELSYCRLAKLDGARALALAANEANEKLLVNTVLRLFAIYLKDNKEELARTLVYLIPRDHMSKLPEFAWKTKRRQYFIDSLNEAIEERDQSHLEAASGRRRLAALAERADSDNDDAASVCSAAGGSSDLQRDWARKEARQRTGAPLEPVLKPIALDEIATNRHLEPAKQEAQQQQQRELSFDEDSDDENRARSKRAKPVNYNIFSKKRLRTGN